MSADAPRLLLIEDAPDTASLIQETLEDHFGFGCVTHCASVAETLALDVCQIDLVLSDMNLSDGLGLDVLDRLLDRRADLPVVFVTAEGILENAIRAIRRGAYDYIVKTGDYLFSIPLIVEKNLAIWRTKQENLRLAEQLTRTLDEVRIKNTQLEEAVNQLQAMAATDPLTGLANRRAFGAAMARSFAEARRFRQNLACIMIDMDGFKGFNDTFGHQRGDELLQAVAEVLRTCCRQSDVAGRFGGDEFVILLPQADERTACQVAHRIQETFRVDLARLTRGTHEAAPVTMSMGLACLARPDLRDDPEELVALADRALYRAKEAGKNRLVIFRQTDRHEPAVPSNSDSPLPAGAQNNPNHALVI